MVHRCVWLWFAAAVVLAGPVCAAEGAGADPGWARVMETYKKDGRSRDEVDRSTVLDDFKGHDHLEAATILLDHLLTDKSEMVLRSAVNVLMGFKSDAAAELLCKRAMEGGGDRTRFRYLLLVIGRMQNPKVVPTLLHFCEDKEMRHVVLAIEGLGLQRVASPEVIEKLQALADEKQEFVIRLSAYTSLAHIPDKRVIPVLITGLKTEGRIAEVAARGLLLLTGKHKGLSHREWDLWWRDEGEAFVLDAEAARQKKLEDVPLEKPEKGSVFYGIPLYAKRVLFVLDKSGSMLVGAPQTRWESLKTELVRFINEMQEDVRFNIIFFSDEIDTWKGSGLQEASQKNKASAIKFVEEIEINPRGMTHTDEAMDQAFKKFVKKKEVETILLFTDGLPTRLGKDKKTNRMQGEGIPLDKIFQQILEDNRYEKVRIHTIGCFTEGGGAPALPAEVRKALRDFLEAIAKTHDGQFLEVK